MSPADAEIVLRLFELRREEKMRTARNWFMKNFKGVTTMEQFLELCPPGTDQNAYFRMVVTYWDMAASFVTCGALDAELYFHSANEMIFIWERVRDFAPVQRTARKNPLIWGDLEAAANRMIEWMNQRTPGAYEAFAAMVRG